MEAYGRGVQKVPCCLAVSGSKLISGSKDRYGAADQVQQYEVRVWDLVTLGCEHILQQPSGAEVWCLTARCKEVWGGVGLEAVLWGRA